MENTGQKTENACKYFTGKPQRKISRGLASSGLEWNRAADFCRHKRLSLGFMAERFFLIGEQLFAF